MKRVEPHTSKGPADRFTGDVHLTMVATGEEPSRVRLASVHFAPCARTAWHSHVLGQHLHVVEGTALVQERGGEIVTLRPGDTIYTPPGVEHWHGASPHTFMVHLALWEGAEGGGEPTTWGALVSDEEYEGGAR